MSLRKAARFSPRKYLERAVAVEEVAAQAVERGRGGGALTAVVRRVTDAPDPEAREYPLAD